LYQARVSLKKTEEGVVGFKMSHDQEFIDLRKEELEEAQKKYDAYIAGLEEHSEENQELLEQIRAEEEEYWTKELAEAEKSLGKTKEGAALADVSSDDKYVALRQRWVEEAREALARYRETTDKISPEESREESQQ